MKLPFLSVLFLGVFSLLFSQEQQPEFTDQFGNEFYHIAVPDNSVARLVGEDDTSDSNTDVFELSNGIKTVKYLMYVTSEKSTTSSLTLDNANTYLKDLDHPTVESKTLTNGKIKFELSYTSNENLRYTVYLWKTGNIVNRLMFFYAKASDQIAYSSEANQIIASLNEQKSSWPY